MEKASRVEDALARRCEAAWREALADLADDDRLEPAAIVAAPALPADFRAFLARALSQPEARAGEHALLLMHHTETLQRMRAEVVAVRDEPQRTLMHTPLELVRMPRLARALDGLFEVVAAAGVAPERAFGAASPEALLTVRPTFAALFAEAYYGAYGPPLYTTVPDLAACARELADGSSAARLLQVIDRRLAAPLVHELSHAGRARAPLSPPYLDECVAAWLGERAMPGISVPDARDPDDDGALYLAAWFTQVGAHLARIVGADALVRAHVGAVAWDDVLPRGLAAAYARMGWSQWLAGRQMHLLGETARPDPWIKAAWLAAAGHLPDDVATLAEVDALPWSLVSARAVTAEDHALMAYAARALTTMPTRSPEGAWRVSTRPTATRLDATTCRLERAGLRYATESEPLHIVVPPNLAT